VKIKISESMGVYLFKQTLLLFIKKNCAEGTIVLESRSKRLINLLFNDLSSFKNTQYLVILYEVYAAIFIIWL
jgi:hypothetical protein